MRINFLVNFFPQKFHSYCSLHKQEMIFSVPFCYAPVPLFQVSFWEAITIPWEKQVTITYINSHFPFFVHFPGKENVAFIILHTQPSTRKYDQVNLDGS